MKNQKFYYMRDNEHKPAVTVCLIKSVWDDVARGVSVCSESEPADIKDGRNRALGRATKALVRRSSFFPIVRTRANEVLESVMGFDQIIDFDFKSEFNPELSIFEKQLLNIT